MAEQGPAAFQRRHRFASLTKADPNAPGAPAFASWADLWQVSAPLLQFQRHILIIDELPYAADADPAMLSALQHAWDQHFERSQAMIVLCGSHVRTMELLASQSPLFGRMTGQWRVQPLPFGALCAFLPGWPPDQQVAVSAMVGGMPAYLSSQGVRTAARRRRRSGRGANGMAATWPAWAGVSPPRLHWQRRTRAYPAASQRRSLPSSTHAATASSGAWSSSGSSTMIAW